MFGGPNFIQPLLLYHDAKREDNEEKIAQLANKPSVKFYERYKAAFSQKFPSWIGMRPIGIKDEDILWIRHRRPAEHYSEKMQLIADLTEVYIDVDADGKIVALKAVDMQKEEAAYMRQFRGLKCL